MSYFIHKTIRKPFNIIDIISGRFVSSIDKLQYILNCHTYFELRYLAQNQKDIKFCRFSTQSFMSKVYSICTGPLSGEVSTFFALRDNDLIQLFYSQEEGLFISKFRITLPHILISSNYIYFSDQILIVSSARGSLGSFYLSSSNHSLTFNEKTTNCVLTNFPMEGQSIIGRIEAGPTLCIYNRSPFSLRYKRDFSKAKVTCAFGLPNNMVAVCLVGRILVINIEDENFKDIEISFPIKDPQKEQAEMRDFIVYSSKVDDNSFMLLTAYGKVIFMHDLQLEIHYIEHDFLRLFPLTPEFLLLTRKGQDHVIINIKQKTKVSKLSSCIGQTGLFLGSQIPYLAPHTYTSCDNLLLLGKQGIGVVSFQPPFDCGEPINGLFSFTVQDRFYILVSFSNNSRLLELAENKLRYTQLFSFRENFPTIGVCHLFAKNGHQYLCQITSEGISTHSPDKEPSFKPLRRIINYASNKKQILLVHINKFITFFQVAEPPQKTFEQQAEFEVPWTVTAITLSPPDPGTQLSEYTAYGAIEATNSFSVQIQVLSSDASAREVILSEKMPSKVESIKFFDRKDSELSSSKIVIGLETGAIIVAGIDQTRKLLDIKTLIHLGTGPCHLSYLQLSQTSQGILALNSRPILITIVNGMPKFCPLAMDTSDYAISIQNQDLFVASSGSKLGVYTLLDKGLSLKDETSMSMSRIPLQSKFVKLCPMRTERFVFIACTNTLFLFDSLKGSLVMKDPLQTFRDEEVRDMDLIEDRSGCQLAICSIKEKPQIDPQHCPLSKRDHFMSVIRLYQIKLTPTTNHKTPPLIGECSIPATSICIGDSSTVFVACFDTMFCFKPCGDTLQIVARINNIGLSVKHLVYLPPTKLSPKGGIYTGDNSRSVKLFHFSEKSKQFKVKCEEGNPRNITALAKYEESLICGGDMLGNLFILEYPAIPLCANAVLDKKLFTAPRRFNNKLNFFIGDPITGVQYTSTYFSYLWYSTLSGGLGGILSLPKTPIQGIEKVIPRWEADFNRKIRMMKYLEQELSSLLMTLCQCDSFAFRNKYYPSSHVIDLDLLGMYSHLNNDRKNSLAIRVNAQLNNGSKPHEPSTPKSIEQDINSLTKYFIEWSSKQ